jgi:hypothetical protein
MLYQLSHVRMLVHSQPSVFARAGVRSEL